MSAEFLSSAVAAFEQEGELSATATSHSGGRPLSDPAAVKPPSTSHSLLANMPSGASSAADDALLSTVHKIVVLSDLCGRWCAEHRRSEEAWKKENSACAEQLVALGTALETVVAEAAAATAVAAAKPGEEARLAAATIVAPPPARTHPHTTTTTTLGMLQREHERLHTLARQIEQRNYVGDLAEMLKGWNGENGAPWFMTVDEATLTDRQRFVVTTIRAEKEGRESPCIYEYRGGHRSDAPGPTSAEIAASQSARLQTTTMKAACLAAHLAQYTVPPPLFPGGDDGTGNGDRTDDHDDGRGQRQPAQLQLSVRRLLPVFVASPTPTTQSAAAGGESQVSVCASTASSGSIVLRALRRLQELGDAAGRWGARQAGGARSNSFVWRDAHPGCGAELASLGTILHDRIGDAPPDVGRHVVLTVVRLAQIGKWHNGRRHAEAKGGPPPSPVAVAQYESSITQLRVLMGEHNDKAARTAAMAECGRLGAAMDAAWFAFPDAEREALMAERWENDGPPTVVGTWEKGDRFCGQHDKPILRPGLRQPVPAELGYVPDNWGATGYTESPVGQKYLDEFLLPASRAALPRLRAAVERVAAAVGLDPAVAVRVPALKTQQRMHEKAGVGDMTTNLGEGADHFWHEYPRQASNVDVARVMLVAASPGQVVRANAMFHSLYRVARVKNRFSPEKPLFGYRDMLLNLEFDGVYCEVQLGLRALVAVRRRMHKFYGVVRSLGFEQLICLAKPLHHPPTALGETSAAAAACALADP